MTEFSRPNFLNPYNMESQTRFSTHQPPEMTDLDERVAKYGGTSSTIELHPQSLQGSKFQTPDSNKERIEELVRENGYLRQEIIFYQESRNAMMSFHTKMNEAYHIQRSAFRELSVHSQLAEGRLEEYWGCISSEFKHKDLVTL